MADPGFPVGGAWTHEGGCGPPMRVLFGENVCENERNGSCRGGMCPAHPLDLPMSGFPLFCNHKIPGFFQDFSRNLMPFSRYIFALAANLQLQFKKSLHSAIFPALNRAYT